MENNENNKNPLSSFIPIFVMAAAVMILMQFWDADQPQQAPPQPLPQANETPQEDASSQGLTDFVFEKGPGEQVGIDTGNYYALLSSQGGRIQKFYLKSHDELRIPALVISKSDDPIAKEQGAFEVTRGNGMDFQPHLFNRNLLGTRTMQIKDPPLNYGAFSMGEVQSSDKSGSQEIRFVLPLSFKNHKFELIKLYRFLKDENFFRQITVLRNLEDKDFVLYGALFYKPFADIGPDPEGADSRSLSYYERFVYYNDDLETTAATGGGGAGGFLCGGTSNLALFTDYIQNPNTLEFAGTASRYFFTYSKFKAPAGNQLNTPDGMLVVNKADPAGREAFTIVYDDFRLTPNTNQPLDLGSVFDTNNAVKTLTAQQRTDAIIVDNQVFFGVRRDESHFFRNEQLAATEFGSAEPDERARRIISSFALFSKIKNAIVSIMRFIYTYTGNYGWAIILIAVAFKLLTFPLNQMQTKSMKRMSALKPEMELINEKYADNPQDKQKKIMELYKKHNVNPAKGCLPLLIQMPIFIALYSAFSESIELWNSPFIWWMTDLASPDTIYVFEDLFVVQNFNMNILPLVMGGSQILQQKLTTVATDPQQKMMMYFMPLIMLFFFWSIPSGVTLYWTVQNIISILWQVVAEKFMKEGDET